MHTFNIYLSCVAFKVSTALSERYCLVDIAFTMIKSTVLDTAASTSEEVSMTTERSEVTLQKMGVLLSQELQNYLHESLTDLFQYLQTT